MIRIVSEKSEAELARERAERERAHAELDARYAARALTANLIRIHRGAGKPYELGRQLTELVKAMQAHWDAAKYWPYNEIADELRVEDDRDWMAGAESAEIDIHYAKRSIVDGALQIAASRLLGQRPQEAAGEHEMYQGVNSLVRAREERAQRWRKEIGLTAARSPRSRATTNAPKKRDPKKPNRT